MYSRAFSTTPFGPVEPEFDNTGFEAGLGAELFLSCHNMGFVDLMCLAV